MRLSDHFRVATHTHTRVTTHCRTHTHIHTHTHTVTQTRPGDYTLYYRTHSIIIVMISGCNTNTLYYCHRRVQLVANCVNHCFRFSYIRHNIVVYMYTCAVIHSYSWESIITIDKIIYITHKMSASCTVLPGHWNTTQTTCAWVVLHWQLDCRCWFI